MQAAVENTHPRSENAARRPRARELTEDAIQGIVDDLRAGDARGVVAQRHGVSTSAVVMIARRVHPKMTLDQKRALSGTVGEEMLVANANRSPVAVVKPPPEPDPEQEQPASARELVGRLRDAMAREGICKMTMHRDNDGVVRCDIMRIMTEEW